MYTDKFEVGKYYVDGNAMFKLMEIECSKLLSGPIFFIGINEFSISYPFKGSKNHKREATIL